MVAVEIIIIVGVETTQATRIKVLTYCINCYLFFTACTRAQCRLNGYHL